MIPRTKAIVPAMKIETTMTVRPTPRTPERGASAATMRGKAGKILSGQRRRQIVRMKTEPTGSVSSAPAIIVRLSKDSIRIVSPVAPRERISRHGVPRSCL